MPNYKYRIIFEDGKIGRGKIMALNKSHAIDTLKKENTQPIMIKRMNQSKSKYKRLDYDKLAKEALRGAPRKEKEKIPISKLTLDDLKKMDFSFLNSVKSKDIITFVNNLYILKKAKFNNVQALQAVYESTENPRFKDIVEDILIGVESGERLNSVMANYPKVFPPMFVNFVKVGEESGTLDTALLYARDYVESSTALKKKIKSAVIPKLLQFVLIVGMMFAALLIGVPMLKDLYATFGSDQEIPAATLIALDFAQWILANWYIIIFVIVLVFIAFFVYINTPRGRYKWDKLKLTFPVAGRLNTNITISKFFQAMLLNLKNGMRIQESLEVSKNVTSNYYFLSTVEAGKSNSLSGGSWIIPFEEKKLFKPMVSQMIEIGMRTDLSEMMEKVNEYINMEIDESLQKFVKWLPDITYLFVGIALIIFTITVMVPLTNVYMGGFIMP